MTTNTKQSTSHITLIEPSYFYANPETMETNVYQVEEKEDFDTVFQRALQEFRDFRDVLVTNGVAITTLLGDKDCPDHLFPNCLSTHEDGALIIYPMLNENRRREKNPDMLEFFKRIYTVKYDFSSFEQEGQFLESTGSLCLDRVNKKAYVGLSDRTNEELARHWGEKMGYDIHLFRTKSHTGKPVYHVDLVMNIGTEFASVCLDVVAPDDQAPLMDSLSKTHDVMTITADQLRAFAGNSLEIQNLAGEKLYIMSSAAYESLSNIQKAHIERYVSKIIHSPIPTIEKYGGGSARCLIMEMF